MVKDPNEWTNVVAKPEHAEVVAWHREQIPKVNKKPAPGSKSRILLYDGTDVVNWQGEDVGPTDPIPEISK